jgi:predicted nucleic-acid-binding protein
MAARARQLIDTEIELRLTETVLLETAYVLQHSEGLSREQIVDLLVEFVQRANISVHPLDKQIVISGLLLCRPSGRVSFGDALIWAAARCAGSTTVYSFDRRFPGEGIDLREP